MNDKESINLTGKDAAKLLEGLTKDPQIRSEDDPSILVEEQFLMDHHALLQGKTDGSSTDNIITILRWESHHTPHPSLVGRAKGDVDRAEEQDSQVVSVHCHN